jgi:hypothetical protein
LEAAPGAQEAWTLAEMPGVTFGRGDDRNATAAGEPAVLESIDLEIAAGAVLV